MHVYVVTLPILHRVVLFAAPKFSFITLLYGSTDKIALQNRAVYPNQSSLAAPSGLRLSLAKGVLFLTRIRRKKGSNFKNTISNTKPK